MEGEPGDKSRECTCYVMLLYFHAGQSGCVGIFSDSLLMGSTQSRNCWRYPTISTMPSSESMRFSMKRTCMNFILEYG